MADLIRMKRGLKKDLPNLMPGELGYCLDTKETFIGGIEGNQPIVVNVFSADTNTFIGQNSGQANEKFIPEFDARGQYNNVAVGTDTLKHNDKGWNNTAIGVRAMEKNTKGYFNTAVGQEALKENIGAEETGGSAKGARNTAIGSNSLRFNTMGYSNTAVGRNAGHTITTGYQNTAVGNGALSGLGQYEDGEVVNQTPKTAHGMTAVGNDALFYADGNFNTAVGASAGYNIKKATNNVAIGGEALMNLGKNEAFEDESTFGGNTAVGTTALKYMVDGSEADAIRNCTGIGIGARVSGNNQVQLGGSGTTVYAHGAVQDRSDARDKADIRDTVLGLEFIKELRPVDFKWDMRDDYIEEVEVTNENGETVRKIVQKPKDGSKKRNRYHHGLIAQEVAAVMEKLGVEFGGYQDHKINGGKDVLTIGYTELIAPLIKAVQELSARVEELEQGVRK